MRILTTDTCHDAGSRQAGPDQPRQRPSQEQIKRFADALKKKRMPEAIGVSIPSLPLENSGGVSKPAPGLSLALAALRALAQSLFMPAALRVQNTENALLVTVQSGVLSGAEMLVAQIQGRLTMTLRAANQKQLKELKSIQHKLKQVSARYSLEEILIESRDD